MLILYLKHSYFTTLDWCYEQSSLNRYPYLLLEMLNLRLWNDVMNKVHWIYILIFYLKHSSYNFRIMLWTKLLFLRTLFLSLKYFCALMAMYKIRRQLNSSSVESLSQITLSNESRLLTFWSFASIIGVTTIFKAHG